LRTKKINKLHCLIKNYCLEIVQDITEELFNNKITLYDNYIKENPFYVILSDIMRQTNKEARELFIQNYKQQLIDIYPYI